MDHDATRQRVGEVIARVDATLAEPRDPEIAARAEAWARNMPQPPQPISRDTTGADAIAAQPHKPSGPSTQSLWESMLVLAKEAGAAHGKLEKQIAKLSARIGGADISDLRAGIEALRQSHAQLEALVARESKDRREGSQAQINRLLASKEERESQLTALDRRLLDTEKELAALRRMIEGR